MKAIIRNTSYLKRIQCVLPPQGAERGEGLEACASKYQVIQPAPLRSPALPEKSVAQSQTTGRTGFRDNQV